MARGYDTTSSLDRPSFTTWLFNALALDNELMGNENVKSRIIYEDTPGGMEFLPIIVEAISTNRVLKMTYRGYNHSEDTHWDIEPRCLKQYRRRWYLICNNVGEEFPLSFALDRLNWT